MEGDIVVVSGEDVLYRASSLGSCTRALAAARQELEPYRGPLPSNIAGTFQLGHETEEVGVRWFEHRGWNVTGRQLEVTVQLTGRIRIVGHIDCLVSRGEPERVDLTVVDVKRQNDEEWAKQSIVESWLWPKYKWQFSSYQVATGMPLAVQRVNDKGEVKLEVVEDLYGRVDLLRRVLEVEQLASSELKKLKCDRDDFPCPYWSVLHDRETWEEREDTELADLALHYKRLGVEIDPLARRRAEIRAQLIKRVEGKVRESTSGIRIRVTKYETKERVIPAGTNVRMTVTLPDEEKEEGGDVARPDE